jgi:hypothetical protein
MKQDWTFVLMPPTQTEARALIRGECREWIMPVVAADYEETASGLECTARL